MDAFGTFNSAHNASFVDSKGPSNACEIIPWLELQRMLDAGEEFSFSLARLLWESVWSEKNTAVLPPVPYVDYQSGMTFMPDGFTIVDPCMANVFTERLMLAIRNALQKGGGIPSELTKEDARERKALFAKLEREQRLRDERAGLRTPERIALTNDQFQARRRRQKAKKKQSQINTDAGVCE